MRLIVPVAGTPLGTAKNIVADDIALESLAALRRYEVAEPLLAVAGLVGLVV